MSEVSAGIGLSWDDRYPSRDALRRDIEGMVASFLESILLAFPPGAIAGITWKGSSLKRWDSPLDYVPELSDVDLHVLFEDDVSSTGRYFGRLDAALDMQRRLDEGFRRRITQPIHVPRIQMIVANVLHREPQFVPAPEGTSRTIYGRADALPEVDREHSRSTCLAHLLEQEQFVQDLPENVADKADTYLWPVLRTMTWRVAPTAPRALEVLGIPYERAWSMNRTHLYEALRAVGEDALAEEYARFYLQGWRYFLSGYTDAGAARTAILAGARVLEHGIDLARRTGPSPAVIEGQNGA